MNTFAEYFKFLLDEKQIDQRELARRVGKSYGYINQLVNDVRPVPKPAIVEQIASGMGCSEQERKTLISFAVKRFFGKERAAISPQEAEKTLQEIASVPTAHPELPSNGSRILLELLRRLPPPGTVWSNQERVSWLKAAEAIFGLEYKEGVQS